MVKALFEFLSTLDGSVFRKIYSNSCTATGLFSELPTLAKHVILRLLFTQAPIPKKVVQAWFTKAAQLAELPESLTLLERLRVLESVDAAGGLPSWRIRPEFQESLRRGLQGGGHAWHETPSATPAEAAATAAKHLRGVDQLDQYAKECWDTLLQFMVNSRELERGKISRAARQLLLDSELCVPAAAADEDDDEDGGEDGEGSGGGVTVGESGFRFLLLDQATQVQTLIVHYLKAVQQSAGEMAGIDAADAVSLIFQLSAASPGRSYPTAALASPGQQACLQHLRRLGLVYQRKRSADRFYPTRLATRAISGRLADSGDAAGGYLIVETNFRVYAFTNSPLQVALVALFTQPLYRFPNLFAGHITRQSVADALSHGITAKQLLAFMTASAHPQLRQRQLPTVLPPTVCDQLLLWERERNRFTYKEGVVYEQFPSKQDYLAVRAYAQDCGVLLHSVDARLVLVVAAQGHEEIGRFYRRHKQEAQATARFS